MKSCCVSEHPWSDKPNLVLNDCHVVPGFLPFLADLLAWGHAHWLSIVCHGIHDDSKRRTRGVAWFVTQARVRCDPAESRLL